MKFKKGDIIENKKFKDIMLDKKILKVYHIKEKYEVKHIRTECKNCYSSYYIDSEYKLKERKGNKVRRL